MPTKAEPDTNGEVIDDTVCPHCGYKSPSAVGLKMHLTRSHPSTEPDEIFERVGKATDALFPKGVPSERIIEIAELQKHMLRVIK